MISPTGSSSSSAATTKSGTRNWPSRRWNHQASISGMAIFMISLGWITMPTSSQRVAPFLVMPTPGSAVTINSATPTTYSGTASCSSRCGGTCETSEQHAQGQHHVAPVVDEARAVVETGGVHRSPDPGGQAGPLPAPATGRSR